ncbi:chemotaxis protein CheD [Svornostia abyssi]|uniref:chemotaxis protein CheD n=1 Tax=Svornostia abyssi TaxID=2898438 RepID=UPI00338F032B
MPETPVRIGELVATKDPEDVLVSVGLGSCIGLAMIDRSRGIVGLAHVMLPESTNGAGPLRGRYANHAVPILLEEVLALGARASTLEVGIARRRADVRADEFHRGRPPQRGGRPRRPR